MPSDWEIGYAIQSPYGGSPSVDLFAAFKEDPFVPNDLMDWTFGIAAVTIPYVIVGSRGGLPGIAAYSASAPDMFMFAGGVALSNTIQGLAVLEGPSNRRTHSPVVTSGFMMV